LSSALPPPHTLPAMGGHSPPLLVMVLLAVSLAACCAADRPEHRLREPAPAPAPVPPSDLRKKDRDCVIQLPFLPYALEIAGIALSLGNVNISGLNDNDISVFPPGFVWNHVQLVSDPYVSKGWIYSLPLSGRGRLTLDIEELKIVTDGAGLRVTMKDFRGNFEGMNPGQESGEFINAFLGTLTDDIADLLTEKLGALMAERRGAVPGLPSIPPLCVQKPVDAALTKEYEHLALFLQDIGFEPRKFFEDFVETAFERFSKKTHKTRI